MRYLIGVVALIAALAVPVTSTYAWYCQPGYADTKANQDNGKCVEAKPTPTPKPTHKPYEKPPTSTPVPVETLVPTAAPTQGCSPCQTLTSPPPASPPPADSPLPPLSTSTPIVNMPPSSSAPAPPIVSAAPAVTQSQSPSSSGAPQTNLTEYCHYEPTTNRWEIRRTTDLQRALDAGGEQSIAQHICDQHVPTLIPTAAPSPTVTVVPPAPTSTPIAEVVATPAPTEEAPPTLLIPPLIVTAPPAPPAEEEVIPEQPPVPQALPETGDGTCATGCSVPVQLP
jgi:hypothetical protein